MTFNNDQLQLVLNYDTNGQQLFTHEERCEIHRAISHKLSKSNAVDIPGSLSLKIVNCLGEISQKDYKYRNEQYFEDNAGIKKIRNN